MAARTNEDAVRAILRTSLSSEAIRVFIADAALWVTEELAGQGLSAERLELVERYLACSLIRVRDLGLKSVSLGDVREQYQADPDVTDYLLRAAALDPSGTVRRTFLPPKETRVAAFWAGSGFADE